MVWSSITGGVILAPQFWLCRIPFFSTHTVYMYICVLIWMLVFIVVSSHTFVCVCVGVARGGVCACVERRARMCVSLKLLHNEAYSQTIVLVNTCSDNNIYL